MADAAIVAPVARGRSLAAGDALVAWALALPAIIAYLLMILLPLVAVLALAFEASDEPACFILNAAEHPLALDAPLHDAGVRQRRPGKLDRPSKAIAHPLDVEVPSLRHPLPPSIGSPVA